MPAPTPNITTRDAETLMDAVAYMLSNDSRTSNIEWILGDVGMGRPQQVPFGFISMMNEAVSWYTAQGGMGGLAAGGNRGLDDWQIPIVLTVCCENHRFVQPIAAVPPASSPFNPANNQGFTPLYKEQPGWRVTFEIVHNIQKVFRSGAANVTVGGAATDTRIVETRPLLQEINEELYRAVRITIQSQQRRYRGD